jgi:uncharacterized protein (DUF2147 family)
VYDRRSNPSLERDFMQKLIVAALIAASATLANAAEPIEGNWKTKSGENASIAACGGAFCITVTTGKYAGKRIGKLSGSGSDYSGEITDPTDDKTYSGSASVNGASMQLKGCVMSVFCKSQTWKRL